MSRTLHVFVTAALLGCAGTAPPEEPKTGDPNALIGSFKVRLKIGISHHGGTKGMIECDTADEGALTISSALATALLELGVAGFPSVIVTRRASGSVFVEQGRTASPAARI